MLSRRPDAGDVVPGTGGVRKVRFAVPGSGRGKSVGFRVFYAHIRDREHVLLFAVLRKNVAENLTRVELKGMADRLSAIRTLYEEGSIR